MFWINFKDSRKFWILDKAMKMVEDSNEDCMYVLRLENKI
jgi:hypothetical protein